MAPTDLPIVDLAPFIHGEGAAREPVGRAFGRGFETAGYVKAKLKASMDLSPRT